jgi:apolipoprotein N-acyltransferase
VARTTDSSSKPDRHRRRPVELPTGGAWPGYRASRWPGRVGLLASSVLLLSLANAPFGQPWLAWIGLVPWLGALRGLKSLRAAFAWGWLGGLLFFAANLWWLWTASIPGVIALIIYLALYWGLAALLLRGLGLLDSDGFTFRRRPVDGAKEGANGAPPLSSRGPALAVTLVLIATVWTAAEWLRAHVIHGFPWMFLGHSQSPLVAMCQIADAVGVSGISFWVALVNGLVFLAWARANRWRPMLPSGILVMGVLLAVAGYGSYRLSEDATVRGPRVMVVQPNHPHARRGDRIVSREAAVDFHLSVTREALGSQPADLVAWSEAVMPPLNAEARRELRGQPVGPFLEKTNQRIGDLAAETGAAIITGGNYVGKWVHQKGSFEGTDLRNCAYLYRPDGRQPPERYDKTELVPFAERVAFQDSVPWLHRVMLWLSPPVAAHPLVAGDPDALHVFTIWAAAPAMSQLGEAPATGPSSVGRAMAEYRFVTPICLENIYPGFISRMVGPEGLQVKRADFIVNLSNDGWFSPEERYQHLQQVVFRCIENRVPQARACNTGISAFVDSCGRVTQTIPAGAEGTAVQALRLDSRVPIYTRYGDVFAYSCLVVSAAVTLLKLAARWL